MVLLDNGHGKETAGKRSPMWADGKQLKEWEFNRDVAKRVYAELKRKGIAVELIVTEETDVSLEERCRRVNEFCKKLGAKNCILVSIHANAGGGTGWEVYTSKGQTQSDKLASIMCEVAQKELKEWKVRTDYSDGDADKEENFYILKHSACGAVLTENLFMDTEKDCRFLLEERGKEVIAKIHIESILKYVGL